MGILNFLKFTLLLIDFLAWPLFALGYPLCASIRAIESGSKYHMRKLVIYWTLFSLISLFELAFIKLIEWIPLWSLIKFIAICWLVMPRFDGACYVYQRLVIPCLSVNVRALVSRLCKPNKEQSLTTEIFVAVTERYIKENGSEAFENLVKSKISNTLNLKCKEPDNVQKDIQQLESINKIEAATIEQLKCKELDVAEKDINVFEPPEKIASTTEEQPKYKEPEVVEKDINALEPPEKIASTTEEQRADAKISEKILRDEACDRLPEAPVKKVQLEWACALCQVTTTSENNLNSHLQGSKHKSMIDELKRSKQDTKRDQKMQEQTTLHGAGSNQMPNLWCNICEMKLHSEIHLVTHLRGRRHSENIQNMSKVEQTTLHGAGSSQTPNLWCSICKLKLLSEIDLAAENIQNMSKVGQTTLHGAGSSQWSKLWCNKCKVKMPEMERRKREEAERIAKLDEIAEKQRQRDRELEEKERQRREELLGRSSTGLSRVAEPSATPRPVEAAPTATAPAAPAPTPGKYVPRFKRMSAEGAENDRWASGGGGTSQPSDRWHDDCRTGGPPKSTSTWSSSRTHDR